MTRVDFYILQARGREARLRFACRLVEKALRHGNTVFIAVDNEEEAKNLDQLLWEFQPESFIPHNIDTEVSAQAVPPIILGFGPECGDHHDMLINLRSDIPAFFSRFQRLTEVVTQDEEVLDRTRTNWKYYRDRGYPLQRHAISA